jgi:hypothetical protein
MEPESKPEYKYVYGIGKQPLNISETELRYAIENTKSNAEAARFLKISFTSYKKYAKLYIDRDTNQTLYDLHKNQAGVGIKKDVLAGVNGPYSIDAILEGKHPNYPKWKLRNRLLQLGMLAEQCNCCGYSERRITDDTVPLMLDTIDGNETNLCFENLQMLCLNCYYQQTGNPFNKDRETFWNYNLID